MYVPSLFLPHWEKPVYKLLDQAGNPIVIDVTTSVSPGLPPNHVLIKEVIPYLKEMNVDKVLDFGAGSLRHSIPLVKAGFKVGAVDFQEGYTRHICKDALNSLCKNDNFCLMKWPHIYCGNANIFRGKFDAALLIYVLQTMPKPRERGKVLEFLSRKLRRKNALIFYCSRYNQLKDGQLHYRVSDGYYMYPRRSSHSFYREFTTAETHRFMQTIDFYRILSFSERGTDQMFIYYRGHFP